MLSNTTLHLNSSLILNSFLDPALCFLPPEMGTHLMVSRYIEVGTLAVFVWDLLNNILNDYNLLSDSKYQIRSPTVIYFISRIFSLGFVTATTVFQTAPANSCSKLKKGLGALFFLSVTSTSLLFFFRTRAVFNGNRWIVAFFAALWLAVAAACSTAIIGVDGFNIESTNYCIDGQIKPFVAAAVIVPLINDTVVFFAITWRLFRDAYVPHTIKNEIVVFSDYLSMFSEAMIQEGQAYYLATVAVRLVAVIMLLDRAFPDILRTFFAVPNVAFVNIMVCRVFRNTIFANQGKPQISTKTEVVPLRSRCQREGEPGRTGDATPNIDDNAITSHRRQESDMTEFGTTL